MALLWAFDLAAFVENGDGTYEFERAQPGWLAGVMTAFRNHHNTDRLAPAQSTRADSQFALEPERIGQQTLSSLSARGLMPVIVPALSQKWSDETEYFKWRFACLSIGTGGSVSMRYEVEVAQGNPLVSDFVSSYFSLIQIIRRDMDAVLEDFRGLLNDAGGPLAGITYSDFTRSRLDAYLSSYECVDLDLDVIDRETRNRIDEPIKTLFDPDRPDCMRQLAALARMSHVEPEHYDVERLVAFRSADIGNREDEFWVVNPIRLMRSHPEPQKRNIRRFYADVVLLAEILLQQLASLAYIEAWLREAKSELRSRAAGGLSANVEEIGDVLARVERISDQLTQPGELLSGMRHLFFRSLTDRMMEEIGLTNASVRVGRAVDIFLSLAAGVFSLTSAMELGNSNARMVELNSTMVDLNAEMVELGERTVELSRSNLMVARRAAIAAIVAAAVAVVGVILSLLIALATGSDGDSDTGDSGAIAVIERIDRIDYSGRP